MTPDRWRQVEDLCHAALARPAEDRAAFLATACLGDDLLQREVESLLTQESSAAGFMSVPAAAAAGSAVLDHAKGSLVGQRLGSYTIRSLLGVGGMGEVYRAHDDTLGREVAIKVLPPAFTADPERRARFEREARMLATLNHPHIGAIYGVEEADGVRALVLELVEGETLAERIARPVGPAGQTLSGPRGQADNARPARSGGLPLADALAIARQVADALEAAHEKGIVHRDLKPANIKITPDGAVKVLDFGLAKATVGAGSAPDLSQAPTLTVGGTREGVILGTAAYMSPEQARGHSVDKRGDIWAFGCVFYEMLTGRLTFPGDTVSDTIAKILEREPDWSALPAATPAPLRRLLLRCLVKDPRQRLRDMGDVRIEIDTIDDVLPGLAEVSVAPAAPARTRRTWLPWVAVAAVAAGFGVWEAKRAPTMPENPLANAQFSRFTDWEGTESSAEISPDGRFVAFVADRDGESDLWLSQVGTGRFVNLTSDIPPLLLQGPILRMFGFTGDGAEIWMSTSREPTRRQQLVPLTGGTPRPFLGDGDSAPSWSSDGARLVYFNNSPGDRLFLADRIGADATQIPVSAKDEFFKSGMHTHNPVWSADGQWIYFVHGLAPTGDMDVWRVRPSGGSPERLTQENAAMNFLAPLNPRTLLYVGRAKDQSGPWLWALDVERKVPQRVTSGLDVFTSVSASRDGRRVVVTTANPTSSLWRVPLLDRPAEDRDVHPYSVPTVRALAPRFGGPSLFYLSARGTGDGLWRVQDGEASEIWKGADAALSEPPAASRDGRRVAVVVRQDGKRHLAIMAADGTNSRTLAAAIDIQGAASQGSADWSPDGDWIAVGGRDAQGPGLFKIPLDGGPPVRLVAGQANNPVWSPDGKLIVYSGSQTSGQVSLLGVRPDGVTVALLPVRVRGGAYRFLPNGTGLVYLPTNQSLDFWLLDLEKRTTRRLTRLSDQGQLNTFDITPDGKHIVFDRSRENSDIVLIDLPK
ncbi:MAG: protein kinase domain-containing protein [Vicinamibacterales bacterium]